MNIAYDLIIAMAHFMGLIVAYPVSIWILDAATSNFSIILVAANRVAMLLACTYAIIALLTLLKNRRKMISGAPQVQIAANGTHSITKSEKKNDKIGRFLNDEKLTQFNSVINQFLIEKKPFLQQKYSLRELASDVDIPVNYLSAFINRYHEINYNDFINRYRVSQSKEMILNGEWKYKTLEAIASDAGFNNRNTFTVAFRKEMGQSPSEYLKGIKKAERVSKPAANRAREVLV
jgi:YesN/AraC family two-component response regulator